MIKYKLESKLDGDIIIYIVSNKLKLTHFTKIHKDIHLNKSTLKNKLVSTHNDKTFMLFPESKDKYSDLEDIRILMSNAINALNNIDDIGKKKVSICLLNASIYNLDKKDNVLDDIIESQILATMSTLYSFDKYKADEAMRPKIISFYTDSSGNIKKLFDRCVIINKNLSLVRDLGNEPGNKLTPVNYANLIGKNRFNYSVKIMKADEIKREGLNNITAMAQGSSQPPRFVIIKYNGLGRGGSRSRNRRSRINISKSRNTTRNKYSKMKNKHDTIVLVGKGVTFDAGGINLKFDPDMNQMKTDMLGSAVVYGIIDTLARLKVKKNVIGLIPLIENMPGQSAIKPGDIITAYNGKTIEVLDTDAEGRLIMACSLAYSEKFKPKYLIDFATLTGQAGTITNGESSIIMSNDNKLSNKAIEIGEKEYERLTRLPIYKEHEHELLSMVADIKNISNDINGTDCIYAGAFLKEFIPKGVKWLHIDICKNYLKESDKYYPRGCTGIGYKLGLKLVMDL